MPSGGREWSALGPLSPGSVDETAVARSKAESQENQFSDKIGAVRCDLFPPTSYPHSMEAVDRAVLERLADELGDQEAVVEIVRGYLDLLPSRLDELGDDAAVDPDNPESSRQRRLAAHTLKSGAQLLGALPLARAAEQVEHGAGSADALRTEARSAARDWRRWLAVALARNPDNR